MRRFRFLPISLLGLIGSLLLFPLVVSAHPLNDYVQSSYITLAGDKVVVDVDLNPGVLIAAQVLPWIDTDQDGAISDAEQAAYVHEVMADFSLQANGADVPLTLTGYEYPPYVDFSAGTGIIRIHMSAAIAQTTAGDFQLYFANTYAPESVNNTYLVNAFRQDNVKDRIQITKQDRDYYQHTMTLSYSVAAPQAAAGSASAASSAETADNGSLQQQLMNALHETSLSPWLIVVAFGMALVLGGLHALTPGHGKTLIAAYLIGSRGTLKHAVALGSIVTITHTLSVILIGLLALFASQYIVPELLVPLLEIGAGLLVVLIGVRLIAARWRSMHTPSAAHPHLHKLPDSVRFSDLLGMGISGGVVPCPEALGILLVAVGLNRVPLGLALIVSFSLGLAVVLIGLGVLLVRFKPLMQRRLGTDGRWQRVLPLVSAVLVTALGLGVMISALASATIAPQTFIAVVAIVVTAALIYELATNILSKRPSMQLAPALSGAAITPFYGLAVHPSILPPRYRDGHAVSNAPMGAADLKLDADGQVAWDAMWTDFCDLALAGGPPHRGTLLEPVSPESIREQPEAYAKVVAEIARGLRLVTGLDVITDASPGWIGLVCADEVMAIWLLRAILVENVSVRREGRTLFFPAGPDFTLGGEIKNVVTVVAKTNHYWTEHAAAGL